MSILSINTLEVYLLTIDVNAMVIGRDFDVTETILGCESFFFLARMTDADRIYRYLVNEGIIVRNRSKVTLCRDCLRITVGAKSENNELLSALRVLE